MVPAVSRSPDTADDLPIAQQLVNQFACRNKQSGVFLYLTRSSTDSARVCTAAHCIHRGARTPEPRDWADSIGPTVRKQRNYIP